MFGISKHEILKRIRDKLVTDLVEKGEVHIDGVGTLKIGGSSIYSQTDSIIFEPDSTFQKEVFTKRNR